MLTSILFVACTLSEANPLIELKESFGPSEHPTIVPYYYAVGHQPSYTTINTAIGKPDHGPRTFVTKSVHQILTQTFASLAEENIHLVYGEGSWGGPNATQSLLPHRTHNNGLYLDIFLPLRDENDQPILFPNTEHNVFGYAVNFTATGQGEAPHTQYHIDWPALITVFSTLCEYGGDKINKVLIAEDFIPTLQSPKLKNQWAQIDPQCRQKLHPIGPLTPYTFANQTLIVDHDDHIHVEFHP
jgi:hypothetical protein